jgi:hypothetical protein
LAKGGKAKRKPPFDFIIQPYSGWRETDRKIREGCIEQVLDMLENPCASPRLRQPQRDLPIQRERQVQWDDFCKVDCSKRLFRLLYRWVPPDQEVDDPGGNRIQGPLVLIEATGPHEGRRKEADVYERLRRLYESLPPDEGHTQLAVEPCCDEQTLHDEERSSIDRKEARQILLRR